MKHNKLSISIVSAFIAALGLTACSSIATEDTKNALVTVIGHNGESIPIKADDIYAKLVDSEDGVTSFYNAILEVMIRDYFQNGTNQNEKYESFKKQAHEKVEADHKKAKNDANTNGTDYDTEWQAILDSNGVKSEKELEEKYLYGLEKEEYTNSFFEKTKESRAELTKEYIGFDKAGQVVNGDATPVYPYHIRHILVKTEGASATDYVTSEITKDQATHLADTYDMLASGEFTFGEVAADKSDDGSKDKFGDLGIMSTKTPFVNEFKLGIYAYDCVYGKNVSGEASRKDTAEALGLKGDYRASETKVATKLNELGDEDGVKGLQQVPFSVFKFLGDKAGVTTDKAGNKVNDGLARYYPRNIMWNQYLNIHNPFVITDDNPFTDENYKNLTAPVVTSGSKTGFRTVKGLYEDKKVLTDEDGRVIIGVRSEHGIHFMIMERSPFETGTTIGFNDDGSYKYDNVDINDYYTTYIPHRDGYPTTNDEAKTPLNTYVNFIDGDSTIMAERANAVKSEIKGFDKMFDYRIFEALKDEGRIKISEEIEVKISQLIDNKRENIKWTEARDMSNAWNTYIDKLDKQYEDRSTNRLIKTVCAFDFENAGSSTNYQDKNGGCYYEA